MLIHLHAQNSGKIIEVYDRILGTNAFKGFVSADARQEVDVASNNGTTGEIDVTAQMTAASVRVVVQSDYTVAAGETIDVDDV